MTSPTSFPYAKVNRLALRSLAVSATILVSLHFVAVRPAFTQSSTGSSAEAGKYPCVFASVSGATMTTALGQCSAPAADVALIDRFEADLRYGSFGMHQTDLVPFDFTAVPLVRAYVSRSSPFEGAAFEGGQPKAFGLNTSRFFDHVPVEAKFVKGNGAKTLQEVRSHAGSSIWLAYDSRSRIWKADDDHDNTARYFYGRDGMLCYAFNTSGMIRHYIYEGTLMTAVEDENRRTLVRNSYTAGHLSSQRYANGDVYGFAYTWLPGQQSAGSVTVTLPDHSTKVVSFTDATPSSLSTR